MTGGTWPVTWSVTSGTLPAGLALDSSSGTISGSPSAKGTYTFTVKASIGSSGLITATKQYSVTIADNQPSYSLTVKNSSLAAGTVGKSYSGTLKAELTGAELPATWSYTGTLPPGLTLNGSGTISGTPTTKGSYTFTVTATFGAFTGSKTFTLTIASPATAVIAPTITTTSLPTGIVGASYSAALKASGTTPITWSASGLPSGLSCSSAGKITGKPKSSGSFTVKVTAKNSAGNHSKTFTLKVTKTTISGTIPSTVARGASVAWTLKASGGTSAYTWSIDSGKPPDGLSINKSTGKVTGKPTKAGTYTFIVKPHTTKVECFQPS